VAVDRLDRSRQEVDDVLWEIERDVILRQLIILIELYSRKRIQSKTAFIKEFFLIAKNNEELFEIADFHPDYWGPSSDAVIDGITKLVDYGVIDQKSDMYYPTDFSRTIYSMIEDSISTTEKELSEAMKVLLDGLSTMEIFGLIYYTYPEMTTESVETRRLEQNRISIAHTLYNKEKVSLEKAAEIAGLPFQQFLRIIKQRNEGDSSY
jgi:predicted HTH domain antitoxin